jgi:hypothetical protein
MLTPNKHSKNMKKHLLIFACVAFLISCKKEDDSSSRKASTTDQTEINKLKLNQIQVLGSHNSYHKRMPDRLYSFLSSINFLLPSDYKVEGLDYYHEALADQLDQYKMRSFEIDIYADPQGGRFYNRQGNVFASLPVASGIDELRKPGYKVMHIPDIDYDTHYYTFKSMLQALKDWSDRHPNHIPIFLLIEGKEETVGDILGFLGFQTAIKFTPALCDDIDTEIKSIFGNDLAKVITPDEIRGSYPTLSEAVLANNWPTIGESRGKFVFVMQGASVDDYLVGHPSLQGRSMFTNSIFGKPEAAFLQYNDPIQNEDTIKAMINRNFIIRSRTDGPNDQNRSGDYSQQQAAFRCGAQILSTDYYRPDPRYKTQPNQFKDYSCQFPNGDLARINPISAADKQNIGKIGE